MDLQGIVVLLIFIYPLWWKTQLVLFESLGLDESSFSSSKSGNRKVTRAHGKHVGFDFVGHGIVKLQGLIHLASWLVHLFGLGLLWFLGELVCVSIG